MTKRKLVRRAMADMMFEQGTTSTYSALTEGRLKREDIRSLAKAREELEGWPLYVTAPKDGMDVEDLAPAIRRRQRQLARRGQTLRLVIVDYLGRFGTKKNFKSETEEVSYISRKIKAAAASCNVVIIALTQLSRALEARDNKRPMLADLRQSGSLEQDADTVVFVYRDEYYLRQQEPPKDKPEKHGAWEKALSDSLDQMELYTSKRREGGLAKRLPWFFLAHQAIRDHSFYRWEPQQPAPSFFDDDDGPLPEERG